MTHGIATPFASKPTAEICWNSSSVSGVKAQRDDPLLAPHAGEPACDAGALAMSSSASAANRTPTATKLSQKPGCIRAQGSSATTTAQAQSQT